MEAAYKQQNRISSLDFNFDTELQGYLHGNQELGRIARINGEYFMIVNSEFANSLVFEKFHALPSEAQLCADQARTYESGGTEAGTTDSNLANADQTETRMETEPAHIATHTPSLARPLTGFGHAGAQAGAPNNGSSFGGLLSQ